MSDHLQSEATRQEVEQLSEQQAPGVLRELWSFFWHRKKWWLMPVVLAILMLGVLMFLSGTAAAPFIYTFF